MLINFILYNSYALGLIFITDKVLCFIINDKARWFQLHFSANMLITYLTYNNVINIVNFPQNSSLALTDSENFAGSMALSIHIYHCLFFPLTNIDLIHHISSVFLSIPINLIYNVKTLHMFYFFLTGLPGGLDYLFLTLYKNNQIHYLTQKNFSSKQNIFIRIPGGIICCYLMYYSTHFIHSLPELICAYLMIIIIFLNVTMFGKMAIENYAIRKYQYEIEGNTRFN